MSVSDEVRKLQNIFCLARQDPQYSEMVTKYNELEHRFGELTRDMTDEEQDIAWGFVCLSDAMSLRLVEILCEKFEINILDMDLGQ